MVSDVRDFPSPTSVTKIREFIGLVGSYRQFIKDFNLIAEPMIKLTRKANPFSWGDEQEKAFKTLIDKITTAPILVHFDKSKKLRVMTDASKIGAGAVLLQLMPDEIWHPVSFASWLFNSAQRNYHTTDRELLSVVLALRKWR